MLSSIVERALERGHEVFFEEDIRHRHKFDVLFCVDPRTSTHVSYNDLATKAKLDGCKIVQRIGDLGTHGKPELLDLVKLTSEYSDALIFPSEWAKKKLASKNSSSYVVKNAPVVDFVKAKRPADVVLSKLRIVSHHWSNNAMKGFEIYQRLDDYCKSDGDVTFTFIGRKPDELVLTNHIQPLDTQGLVEELPKHNVYLTASKQEAGANHVLEAMAVGLPVLYHSDGGSINEYCSERGIEYDSFEKLVEVIKGKRDELRKLAKLEPPTRTSQMAGSEYVDILEELVK